MISHLKKNKKKRKKKKAIINFENNLELNPKGLLKRFISKPKTAPRIIDLCLDTWIIVIWGQI